jgi:hypothetical protein
VNADLFFLLALQQACSEGVVRRHYLSCGSSVVPLHTGLPFPGYGMAWQMGAQVCSVPSYKMGPAQYRCPHLRLAQHVRVHSDLPRSTSLRTDSLGSLTPAGRELGSSPSPPLLPTDLRRRVMVSRSGQHKLLLSVSRTMNSFGCLQ